MPDGIGAPIPEATSFQVSSKDPKDHSQTNDRIGENRKTA
jgi:hypothetical protein